MLPAGRPLPGTAIADDDGRPVAVPAELPPPAEDLAATLASARLACNRLWQSSASFQRFSPTIIRSIVSMLLLRTAKSGSPALCRLEQYWTAWTACLLSLGSSRSSNWRRTRTFRNRLTLLSAFFFLRMAIICSARRRAAELVGVLAVVGVPALDEFDDDNERRFPALPTAPEDDRICAGGRPNLRGTTVDFAGVGDAIVVAVSGRGDADGR